MHEEFAFQATLLLIQCSIGEYDMATMIDSIELLDDAAKDGSELKLSELSAIVD